MVTSSSAESGSGRVSPICFSLLLPHWSVTVTVTVIAAVTTSPASGLWVTVRSALSAVQSSDEMARTSPVRSGTMNTQSVDASSRSRLTSSIVGSVPSPTVIVIGVASAVQPLASSTCRLMVYGAPQVSVLAAGAVAVLVVVVSLVVMSPVSESVIPSVALHV